MNNLNPILLMEYQNKLSRAYGRKAAKTLAIARDLSNSVKGDNIKEKIAFSGVRNGIKVGAAAMAADKMRCGQEAAGKSAKGLLGKVKQNAKNIKRSFDYLNK